MAGRGNTILASLLLLPQSQSQPILSTVAAASPAADEPSSCTNAPDFIDMYGDGCDFYEADDRHPLFCRSYGRDGEPGNTPDENCCVCMEAAAAAAEDRPDSPLMDAPNNDQSAAQTGTSDVLPQHAQLPQHSPCVDDTPGFADVYGNGCDYYKGNPFLCRSYGSDGEVGSTADENCCVCSSFQEQQQQQQQQQEEEAAHFGYDPENPTETCYEVMYRSDANGDGILQTAEYTHFLSELSGGAPETSTYSSLPFVTKVNFAHLSCRCKFEPINGGDECCEGASSGIFLPLMGLLGGGGGGEPGDGIYLPQPGVHHESTLGVHDGNHAPLSEEGERYVQMVCADTQEAIKFLTRPKFMPTEPPSASPSLGPMWSPVADWPSVNTVTNSSTVRPTPPKPSVEPTTAEPTATAKPSTTAAPTAVPTKTAVPTITTEPSTHATSEQATPVKDSSNEESTVASVMNFPNDEPTLEPVTKSPSQDPSANQATSSPTEQPTANPATNFPTNRPTLRPVTSNPTFQPSSGPVTDNPTSLPSAKPTTGSPSRRPSGLPVRTHRPTEKPVYIRTRPPLSIPVESPTQLPTLSPSEGPVVQPTASPSTDRPTRQRTSKPGGESQSPTVSFPPSDNTGNLGVVGSIEANSGNEGDASGDNLDPVIMALIGGISAAAIAILAGSFTFLFIRRRKRDDIGDSDSEGSHLKDHKQSFFTNGTNDLEGTSLEFTNGSQDEEDPTGESPRRKPMSSVAIRKHAKELLQRVDQHEAELAEDELSKASSTSSKWGKSALRPVERSDSKPRQVAFTTRSVKLRPVEQSKSTTTETASLYDRSSLRQTGQLKPSTSAQRVDVERVSLRPTDQSKPISSGQHVNKVSLRRVEQSKSTQPITSSSIDKVALRSTEQPRRAISGQHVNKVSLRRVEQSKSTQPITSSSIDKVALRSTEQPRRAISASNVGKLSLRPTKDSKLTPQAMDPPKLTSLRQAKQPKSTAPEMAPVANKARLRPMGRRIQSVSPDTVPIFNEVPAHPMERRGSRDLSDDSSSSAGDSGWSSDKGNSSTSSDVEKYDIPESHIDMNWDGVGRIASLLANHSAPGQPKREIPLERKEKESGKSSRGFFGSFMKGNEHKGKAAGKLGFHSKQSPGEDNADDIIANALTALMECKSPSAGLPGGGLPSPGNNTTPCGAPEVTRDPNQPHHNTSNHSSQIDNKKRRSHFNGLTAKDNWAGAADASGTYQSTERRESEDDTNRSLQPDIPLDSMALNSSSLALHDSVLSGDRELRGTEANFRAYTQTKNAQGIGQNPPSSLAKRVPLPRKPTVSNTFLSKEYNAQRTSMKLREMGVDSKSANRAGKIVQEHSLKWITRRKTKGNPEEGDNYFDIGDVISVLSKHGFTGHDIAFLFSRTPEVAMIRARGEDGLPSEEMREVLARAPSRQ